MHGVFRLGWRCREMAATDRNDIVVAAEKKSVGMTVLVLVPHFRYSFYGYDRTPMRQRPERLWPDLAWARARKKDGRRAEGRPIAGVIENHLIITRSVAVKLGNITT